MNAKPKPIPLYLVLLLAVFLAFLGWSARQAATDGARITDRDYYSKGLRYNTSMVERRAATVLGWQVDVDLDRHTLSLRLRDRTDQPVAEADVVLTLITPSTHIPLRLEEVRPGHYLARLPDALSGEIPARYSIQRQHARIERQLLINLPAGNPH